MKKIISGWIHKPGEHCASTVLSDLTYFYRLNLSEPFCLGLGAGLGFFYLQADALSPSRMIMTRAHNLEGNFFQALDIDFSWQTESDPEKGWQKVKELIDKNIPVLLHADIYYLDHYRSKTHFPGHVILLWGYDLERKIAYIADTGWQGLVELPLSSLEKARYSQVGIFSLKGDYFPAQLPQKLNKMPERIVRAILLQASLLLDVDEFAQQGAWSGVKGMQKTAQELESWQEAEDSSWCFRWAYQIIERRGTGGGAFRRLYAEFLRQASELVPELKDSAPYEKMEKIAQRWSELAGLFKELSEIEHPPKNMLRQASDWMEEIAEREEEFFERARAKLK